MGKEWKAGNRMAPGWGMTGGPGQAQRSAGGSEAGRIPKIIFSRGKKTIGSGVYPIRRAGLPYSDPARPVTDLSDRIAWKAGAVDCPGPVSASRGNNRR